MLARPTWLVTFLHNYFVSTFICLFAYFFIICCLLLVNKVAYNLSDATMQRSRINSRGHAHRGRWIQMGLTNSRFFEQYIRNTRRQAQTYSERLIECLICSIEWRHRQWPCLILKAESYFSWLNKCWIKMNIKHFYTSLSCTVSKIFYVE